MLTPLRAFALEQKMKLTIALFLVLLTCPASWADDDAASPSEWANASFRTTLFEEE